MKLSGSLTLLLSLTPCSNAFTTPLSWGLTQRTVGQNYASFIPLEAKRKRPKKPVASSSEQGETASRSVTVLETEPAPVVEETKAEEEPKSVKATNGAAQKLEEEAVALKKKLKIWKLK